MKESSSHVPPPLALQRHATPHRRPMNERPLFVDLDGTLVRTDLLVESLIAAVRRDVRVLLKLPAWVLAGRAAFKSQLAGHGEVDVENLPFRDDVVEFLRQEKAKGRLIVLATAADERCARAVAAHLDLFDDVLASDGSRNLKRDAKLAAINDYCRDRGLASFAYIGDSSADLPIWAAAAERYAVAPTRAVESALRRSGEPPHVFPRDAAPLATIVRALRPYQWVKNFLVFIPVIMAGDYSRQPWIASALAFAALSSLDSAVILLSDCLNVAADRRDTAKRLNPFASGALPLTAAPRLALLLAIAAAGIAVAVSWRLAALLVAYLVVAMLDSFWLKHKPPIHAVAVAGLYAMSVLAGGLAAQVVRFR